MSDYITLARGILPDRELMFICEKYNMIRPWENTKNQEHSPSHGMSSYGYDITLGTEFKTYKPGKSVFHGSSPLEPGKVCEDHFENSNIFNPSDGFVLGPNEFCLARSEQIFDMPANVVGLVKDKSTYARMGISLFNTVLEPGWKGVLTLEIVNHSNRSVILRPYRGIAQVLFYGCEPCNTPYGNKGKYQGQTGVQIPL